MDRTRTTRRQNRRACPYSKPTGQRWTRAAEGEHSDTSDDDLNVRLLRRLARVDGKVPSPLADLHRESEDEPEPYAAQKLPDRVQRAAFRAKYKQDEKLGEGGCGSVFAGSRRSDDLPVAIKHVPRKTQFTKHVDEHGNRLPMEVAIMLKLMEDRSGSAASSSHISLLDWYDLKWELILVLERPVPCTDLDTYITSQGGSLEEEEAKFILKQLLDAALDLQDKHIFHRDIKMENILIETGSDTPRMRLIDFGMSCFVKRGATYRHFYGTPDHIPPELFTSERYRAGPTTSWQLGVVLFEMVHRNRYFETVALLTKSLRFSKKLSSDCKDFLQRCLTEDPKQRLTLEQFMQHPWLR